MKIQLQITQPNTNLTQKQEFLDLGENEGKHGSEMRKEKNFGSSNFLCATHFGCLIACLIVEELKRKWILDGTRNGFTRERKEEKESFFCSYEREMK